MQQVYCGKTQAVFTYRHKVALEQVKGLQIQTLRAFDAFVYYVRPQEHRPKNSPEPPTPEVLQKRWRVLETRLCVARKKADAILEKLNSLNP